MNKLTLTNKTPDNVTLLGVYFAAGESKEISRDLADLILRNYPDKVRVLDRTKKDLGAFNKKFDSSKGVFK